MPLAGVLDGLLDLLFPKRCVQCRAAGAWLCEPCAGGLRPLPEERCQRCGAPGRWGPADALPPGPAPRASRPAGARPLRPAGVCPECRERELAFGAAAAAFMYEGPARALVTACKFRALRSLADEMARLAEPAFAAACAAVLAGPSSASPPELLVTWVPGHREHALERGFNQAELLARGLARRAGVPYAPLLRRVRHGARQSGLDRTARAANVRDAFALREEANRVLRKLKRVVIIDDVYTTGETLNHCAKALAGADLRSQVFTFARTVRAPSSQASLAHAVQKERCQ